MDIRQQADEILANAERELKRLIAAATNQGRYSELGYVAQIADRLSASARTLSPPDSAFQPTERSSDHVGDAILEASPRDGAAPRESEHAPRKSVRVRYPLFFRETDKLVKVAWSRSQASEYEHRAGKAVLDRVIDALQHAGGKRQTFDLESLGQLTLGDNGSTIPTYQVYLCAAWLRSRGLIVQNGRKDYTLADANRFKELAEVEWEKLPSR